METHINALTESIIGSAIEVHRHLGPGLLESAYEECLCYELSQRGIRFGRQVELPVNYKEVCLDRGYKMDIVVQNEVIVELKTVDRIHTIHEAQLLSYLKLSNRQVGLILNFHTAILKHGIKRMVNNYRE